MNLFIEITQSVCTWGSDWTPTITYATIASVPVEIPRVSAIEL